jgi:ribosomal-protein-alanine N-acetyltransferase
MNDTEINKYLESRSKNFTLKDIEHFVDTMLNSKKDYLFGIFDVSKSKHIGNIKIGSISDVHKRADVGLIIGEKLFWGKGIATEAIGLVTKFAFEKLELNKLYAGMYSTNVGSYKAFIKAGYEKVAQLRNHACFEGSFVDSIMVDITKQEYYKNK